MKQPYCVEITRTTTHRYIVPDMNSPEEAEDVAMRLLEDGDEGEDVGDLEVIDVDVYPTADNESED